MSKTNQELARAAAERIDDLRDKICEDWPHELAKIIADAYAEAFPRWIPCSERMPDRNEPILFYRHGQIHQGRFIGGGEWHSLIGGYYRTDVTHWQPLPQPPEVTT